MKILRSYRRVAVECYGFCFDWLNEPGSGFSFPCDRDGNILQDQMGPLGWDNLKRCQNGEYHVVPKGVVRYASTYPEYAQGQCECGNVVELVDPLTNTCEKCGRDYNGFGQLLASRSQWEEPMDPADYY